MLRRDRVSLPVWILSVAAFCVVFVPALPQVAGTPDEVAVLAAMMDSPAMVAMCGMLYGDAHTLGIMYTQLMIVWSALLVAVMNILIVVRHTRGDEDEGRLEVVRALPTGAAAHLGAVTVLMVGVDAVLTVLMGVAMPSFGVDSIDWAGSWVYAAALGICGLFFGAVTLVIVQLVHSARGAIGAGLVVLGGLYVLRAYGDVSSETAAWISPLGLIQRTFPFYADRWWPLGILALVCVILIVAAFVLNSMRDMGQGLVPRLGGLRAHAGRTLYGEWGLSWRLVRGTVVAWGVAVFLLSAGYGSVMGEMEGFVQSSPIYQAMMGVGADTVDVVGPVVSMLLLMMAILGAVPVLTTAYKIRAEEGRGRMEGVLAAPVSRVRLYGGYAGLIVLIAVAMQVLAAAGFWMVASAVMTDPVPVRVVVIVAFNFGAAVLFFGGLGLFLTGCAPRLTLVGWAYLIISFLIVYMGGLLDLPRWVARLTPFGLVQRWPSEPFSWWPWIGLVAGGVVLAVVGALGWRRRDVI